jgi:hypothetical protein
MVTVARRSQYLPVSLPAEPPGRAHDIEGIYCSSRFSGPPARRPYRREALPVRRCSSAKPRPSCLYIYRARADSTRTPSQAASLPVSGRSQAPPQGPGVGPPGCIYSNLYILYLEFCMFCLFVPHILRLHIVLHTFCKFFFAFLFTYRSA